MFRLNLPHILACINMFKGCICVCYTVVKQTGNTHIQAVLLTNMSLLINDHSLVLSIFPGMSKLFMDRIGCKRKKKKNVHKINFYANVTLKIPVTFIEQESHASEANL